MRRNDIDPDVVFEAVNPAVKEDGDPTEARLWAAARGRRRARIQAALDQMKVPLSPDWVYDPIKCPRAVACSADVFRQILDHSAPLDAEDLKRLVGEAVDSRRPEHLELLLERIRQMDEDIHDLACSEHLWSYQDLICRSLLGIAVFHRDLRCTQVLLHQAGPEPVWSSEMLTAWSMLGMGDKALDRCLRAVARQWMPESWSPRGPLPFPPGLKLIAVLEAGNAGLAEQMLSQGAVSLQDARAAFRENGAILTGPSFHPLLNVLLTKFPQLLRANVPVAVLTVAMLIADGGIPPVLAPWVRCLRRKQRIVLDWTFSRIFYQASSRNDPCGSGNADWRSLLERWRRRLGPRPVPVLPRGSEILTLTPEWDVPLLVERCEVRGAIPKDGPSALARQLVQSCSLRQVRRALAPGGLLEGEDLGLLAQECPSGAGSTAADRAKRALLLAHAK